MQKAQAVVDKVAKSGSGKPITLETAYERVLMDPANVELAKAALYPAAMKKRPSADDGEDDVEGHINDLDIERKR